MGPGQRGLRRLDPFGNQRGAAPASWPGQRGFVGGAMDPSTGLTHLGAREYDPTTGRFLGVDPVIDTDDPQQMNGYAYSDRPALAVRGDQGGSIRLPTAWSGRVGLMPTYGLDA